MRFVFLALMCVFAGIHAARSSKPPGTTRSADFWDTAGRLFFRIAASLMFVLVAVGSRTGVKQRTYYMLILIGLCVSLASDILLGFSAVPRKGGIFSEETGLEMGAKGGGVYFTAGGLAFTAAASAVYIGAFYSNAAFSWYDAAFFVLLSALALAVMYNKKRGIFKMIPLLIFILISCAMSAKALSMLFVHSKRYIFACFAAAGATLLACSNTIRAFSYTERPEKHNITNAIIYYIGQAFIALSVMI